VEVGSFYFKRMKEDDFLEPEMRFTDSMKCSAESRMFPKRKLTDARDVPKTNKVLNWKLTQMRQW
jgi:hypothetical protein